MADKINKDINMLGEYPSTHPQEPGKGFTSQAYSSEPLKPKPDFSSYAFESYDPPEIRRQIAMQLPRERMTRSSLSDLSKSQRDEFMQVLFDELADPNKKPAASIAIGLLAPEAEIQYPISDLEAEVFSDVRLALQFGTEKYPKTPENIRNLKEFWQSIPNDARAEIVKERQSISTDVQRYTRPPVFINDFVLKWGRYDSWLAQGRTQEKIKVARAEELAQKMRERNLTVHSGGLVGEQGIEESDQKSAASA